MYDYCAAVYPKRNGQQGTALGPASARLVATLYAYNRPIFHFREAAKILGGRTSAANALSQLVHNGIVTRLKAGTFRLVPFELGFEREYLGNPYVVARELITFKTTSLLRRIFRSC